jgi:hypothetical protein
MRDHAHIAAHTIPTTVQKPRAQFIFEAETNNTDRFLELLKQRNINKQT